MGGVGARGPWPIGKAWRYATKEALDDSNYEAAVFYVWDSVRDWDYKDEYLPRYVDGMYEDPDLSSGNYALLYEKWTCEKDENMT